jgi:multicomponent Na+:H+ antiporter subunit A
VRNFTRLGGLWEKMPVTGTAAALAGLSMAGIPPFFGFVGKELIYEAATHFSPAAIAVTIASVLANVALVAAAGLLVLRPFWGEATDVTEKAHRPAAGLWVGPVVLGVLDWCRGFSTMRFWRRPSGRCWDRRWLPISRCGTG